MLNVFFLEGKPISTATFLPYNRHNIGYQPLTNTEFAKDSSCYIDILRYFLEINQRTDLINNIPQLNLWLEFGVSEKTHLSLLSLGLSRNTVIALSDRYITNTQMSQQECINWLKQLDLEALEISSIIKEDIKRIL